MRGTTPLPTRIETNVPYPVFVGIVRDVIHKESSRLAPIRKGLEVYPEEMNNRHWLTVTPTDGNDPKITENAYFINNSHEVDMPIAGEAVLCLRTQMGNIVIDRLSPFAFGKNYDPKDASVSANVDPTNVHRKTHSGVDPAYGKYGLKRSITEVRPFYFKPASYNRVGRNSQYLILDTKPRLEPSGEEKQWTEDGTFVKLGIKRHTEQTEHRLDPSKVTLTEKGKIQPMMEQKPFSVRNPSIDTQSWNAVGAESDDLYFSSRKFNVSYSGHEILENAKNNYYEDAPRFIEEEARRIHIGRYANHPLVLGWKHIEMWEEFARGTLIIASDLMVPCNFTSMTCVPPVVPTPPVGAPLPPQSVMQLAGSHQWAGRYPRFVEAFIQKWCRYPYPSLSHRAWTNRGSSSAGSFTPDPDQQRLMMNHLNYPNYSTLL